MGSPKKPKDQAASVTSAVASKEIYDSNLTASLSLGNAQRKSWMSSGHTPFITKFVSSKKSNTRTGETKAGQKSRHIETTKTRWPESNGEPAKAKKPEPVFTSASEPVSQNLQTVSEVGGAKEVRAPPEAARPKSPAKCVHTSIQDASNTSSFVRLSAVPVDRLKQSTKQHIPEDRPPEHTVNLSQPDASQEIISNCCDSVEKAYTASSPPVVRDGERTQSSKSSSEDCEILETNEANSRHSDSIEVSSSRDASSRRPSNLLIPPIRRSSLDLGMTPLSESSEARSPYDYSVAPTPPAIVSPATELSPASVTGTLKRVHDTQPDSPASSKRSQPPSAIHNSDTFWEILSAASKAQSTGNRSDVGRMMMQCELNVTETFQSRANVVGRGDYEQSRLGLLQKACHEHDYSFLMIHQLFCYSSIPIPVPGPDRLSIDDRRALQVLNLFLASNVDISPEMVMWFSKFPGTSPAVKAAGNCSPDLDLWYSAALSTIHGIANRWAGPDNLFSVCMARGFPPVISEMQEHMNVYSKILQQVIFTAMLRKLMPDRDPRYALHEAVFQRDTQVTWGLGVANTNIGISCAEEHRRISLSHLLIGSNVNGSPIASIPFTATIPQATMANGDLNPATAPLTQNYNPQMMWPRVVPSNSSPPNISLQRRFSNMNTSLGVPNNDTPPGRDEVDRRRPQSLLHIMNPDSSLFRETILATQQQNSPPANLSLGQSISERNNIQNWNKPGENRIPPHLRSSSRTNSLGDQGGSIASISPQFHQYSVIPNSQSMGHQASRRNDSQRGRQWQIYQPPAMIRSQSRTPGPRGSTQRLAPAQPNRPGQTINDRPRALSPRLETGTSGKCFRFIKHIYRPVDTLSGVNTQYQQKFVIPESVNLRRAHTAEIEGRVTTFLFPNTLTLRVRCLKVHPRNLIRTDEDWVVAEQYWPMSIAILVNDIPLTLQRKSAYGKDLPTDITNVIKEGDNTLSVATFSMPKKSAEQYLVGIEAIETVTYDQIKTNIQCLPLEVAKKRITSKMAAEDPDIEVLDPSITVDLTDPFSSVLFKIPARGVSCSHDQCFDLDTFLSTRMGSGSKKNGPCGPEEFKCPICKGDARPNKIIVDGFLQTIRARLEEMGRLDAKAIQLDIDGNWVIKEEAPPPDDMDRDDEDEIGLPSPISNATPRPSITDSGGQSTGPSRPAKTIEVIDLD